ncbi:MAG: AmmeMemoRadiSam system protein B [Oscillospiraceae bacterium]|nr:AmmeMemoRadiSam system protein B [Oscillospiraceae bacterium]
MKMLLKKITALFCCGIILSAAGGCSVEDVNENTVQSETVSAVNEASSSVKEEKMLHCTYYDFHNFNLHLSSAVTYDTDEEILCGTIPHHLLAGNLIAGFMHTAALSREKTDTVVIAATMHFTENSPLCTSYLDWDTPFGTLECDESITSRFEQTMGAVTDDDMAELDHGISALIPYVKYYFPDSEIAFLLIDNRASKNTPDTLSDLFTEIASEKDCLFLFSADFSHYLEPHETELHDKQTLEAVMSWDFDTVASMTDSNVDSPYVLGTFMHLAEKTGREITMLDHSNSLILSGIPYSPSLFGEGLTSYYVFAS